MLKSSKSLTDILNSSDNRGPAREMEIEYIVTLPYEALEVEPTASGERQFRCRTRMLAADCSGLFLALEGLSLGRRSKATLERALEKALERIALREVSRRVVSSPRKLKR